MKTRLIEFVDVENYTPEQVAPKPARTCLPNWFTKTKTNIPSKTKYSGRSAGLTIKKCMPVMDAMSIGYILFTPTDLHVERTEDGRTLFSWPSNTVLAFQDLEQAEHYPGQEGRTGDYPKWVHPWGIKTPKGYSSLFLPPMHHGSTFRILEGLVDTDTYTDSVSLPFLLLDPNFTGLIPAGTPMAQVIPIKREAFKHTVSSLEELKYKHPLHTRRKLWSKFYSSYREQFWSKKEYR